MGEKLKILFIASEMAPFIKTGGLGDVVSVLPKVLSDLGHEVMCVIPKYQDLNLGTRFLFETARAMNVWMGTDEEWCSVFKVEEGGIPVFLIENHKYFTRPLLYHDREFKDYADNPARFAFFTRAALDTARLIKFKADIVHVHDWQSALAPAYLKTWHWNDPVLARAASVLTIHNATYQGIYPASWYPYLGLSKKDYNPDGFECYGGVNFLKGGIVFADAVNTVSPTYAKEISAPYSPPGLAPYLTNKGDAFLGILNGVDYDTWNPQTDIFIPARYSNSDKTGKKQCKRELQKRFGLKDDPDVLLIGVVGRFTDQKGYALLSACVDDIMHDMAVQFVILGSGDPGLESFFREIPKRHPGRAGSWIGYDERLSHMIEAGADLFLMPSLFEPCGLNQLYSLKYGTLPLVRSTGGLEDTVEQYDEARGEGTGFKFWDPKPEALYYTVGWAVSTYYDRRAHWDRMVDRAMAKEFSWTDSGNRYLELYEKAKNRKFDWDKRFIIK